MPARLVGWTLLVTALLMTSCHSQGPPISQDSEVDRVFDVNDPQAGFQRSMVIEISPRQEDCFFIDRVGKGHRMNIHWNVSEMLRSPIVQ